MPDPGVRSDTGSGITDAFRSWLYNLKGGDTPMAQLKTVAATYLGRDYNGQAVYRFSVQYQSGTRLVSTNYVLAVQSGAGPYSAYSFSQPDYSRDPDQETIGDPTQMGSGDSASGSTDLQVAQDYAYSILAKYAHLMSTTDLAGVRQNIANWSGSSDALRKYALFIEQDLSNNKYEISPTAVPIYADQGDMFGDLGGFGGGGGGGGFAGPVYRAPDRRVVEDFVKGRLVSLVGQVDEKYVESFTDLYMRDHKRNWDSQSQEIDPAQSVTEAIRKTGEYQTIHKNRPKGEDENSWIAARRAEAERAGLAVSELDQFAITQATVAGDLSDQAAAAANAQFQGTGRAPAFLDQKFRNVATAMFMKVGR